MEFFRISRDIPFMRHALVFNVISLVTFIAAIVFLSVRGLNLGVDFRGGTVIEVNYGHSVDFNKVRQALDKMGLGTEASAQSFGASDTATTTPSLTPTSSATLTPSATVTPSATLTPTATRRRATRTAPPVSPPTR